MLLFSIIDEGTASRLEESTDRQVSIDRPHDESRPLHARDHDPGPWGEGDVGAAGRPPSLTGEMDVAHTIEAADEIECDRLVAHQPPVNAPRTESSTAGRQRHAHPRSDEDDAHCRHQHGGDDLGSNGLWATTAITAAAKQPTAANSSVEGEVVQLKSDQHDAHSDPCDGQANTFLL